MARCRCGGLSKLPPPHMGWGIDGTDWASKRQFPPLIKKHTETYVRTAQQRMCGVLECINKS